MANFFSSASSARHPLAALVNPTQILAGLALSLSLVGGLAATVQGQAAQGAEISSSSNSAKPASRSQGSAPQILASPAQQMPQTPQQSQQSQQMPDGVYLYGQSAQPQTVGSEYLVFEVTEGAVVGGFYMPHSSFDCFHGSLQADKLALTVVDSYERTAHPYAVALSASEPVASVGGNMAPLGLSGYHRISSLSDMDQQILATCKADQKQ